MAFQKIYLTNCETDITFPEGPRWLSRTVRMDQKLSRYKAHWKRGVDVDNVVIVLIPRNVDPVTGAAYPDKIGNTPWIAAAAAGALDGCDITLQRAYFGAWPVTLPGVITPTGIITIATGRIAEVDITDTLVAITVNDYRELLTQKMPLNLFQAPCIHTLFDFGCQLVEQDFAASGTAAAGTTTAALVAAAPMTALGSGTFTLGKIEMTSGLNEGFRRTVKSSDGVMFSLMNPLPFDVQVGDTFDAFSGCDKTFAACTAFGNQGNFGGELFIPEASTAL